MCAFLDVLSDGCKACWKRLVHLKVLSKGTKLNHGMLFGGCHILNILDSLIVHSRQANVVTLERSPCKRVCTTSSPKNRSVV